MVTFISFYAEVDDSKYYMKSAIKLKQDCDRFNLQHIIEERKSTGDWLTNTRLKPFYILDIMQRIQQPVCWLDVDATIKKFPIEVLNCPDQNIDIAAAEFNGISKLKPPLSIRSTTVFFNYNINVIKFIQDWCALCKFDTNYGDHRLLDHLWKQCTLKKKLLPSGYAYVKSDVESVIKIGLANSQSRTKGMSKALVNKEFVIDNI